MFSQEQFEQLMLQYNQLKNGSEEIRKKIANEDYDSVITMLKAREALFLSCKNIRNYLELTPEQEEILNNVLDEIRKSEQDSINSLTLGMENLKKELKKIQGSGKIQQAYDFDENKKGNIVNIKE